MTEFSDLDALAGKIADQVLELIDLGNQTPIVLVDGRAGSGKSTLADLVQRQLFKDGESLPRVIHMDDLYFGWDGLQAGVDYLLRFILGPISKHTVAEWQEFDWAAGERVNWREFRGGTPLIIEGCGSLSAPASEVANIRVWLEVDETTRHERWLKREGTDEFWARWAAQEVDFYAREKSHELADLVGP
ncbi:ATP-binding protein [Rhodoluna sp.]|uniref:ATP-binding protein n=1 Tax=Rhodoluna sp. TaxID=1969481 RepID=UPI0025DD16C8|nr:ATP-binding protein [Rhodoluna sp.]